jgi:predicted DNA-binding transcriptional regulator YafY
MFTTSPLLYHLACYYVNGKLGKITQKRRLSIFDVHLDDYRAKQIYWACVRLIWVFERKTMNSGTPKEKARGRVSRIVRLLTALSKADKGHTAADLAKLFGVSRRTLFRDLREIREIGIHLGLSRSRRRYAMTPEQFLPAINLSQQELLGLLLMVHKMRNQLQMPFGHSALLAATKIESCLPLLLRRRCEMSLERISVKNVERLLVSASLDDIFKLLQSAVERRKKVCIDYDPLNDGNVISCEVSPYRLIYRQRAWYLVGLSSFHKMVSTFKLSRVRGANVLDESSDRSDSFDLAEYLGCAWAMKPEGKMYHVRLHFDPRVASSVADVLWHKSQQVTRHRDGSVTLNFRVDGLGEITWWILSYGDQVEVLSPSILRDNITKIAKRMREINNNAQYL